MEQQKKHDIALMKYSAIAPVISGLPAQYKSFSEYFREVSERGILHPDAGLRHYATSTIAKWYELYVKDGFDALQPSGRSDEGKTFPIWKQESLNIVRLIRPTSFRPV